MKYCDQNFPTRLKGAVADIKCGIHSGFKPCCIFWYISVWKHRYLLVGTPLFDIAKRSAHKNRCGYIPCPKCAFRKDFIKVKRCNCAQHHAELDPNRKGWSVIPWSYVLLEK